MQTEGGEEAKKREGLQTGPGIGKTQIPPGGWEGRGKMGAWT